jgi:hypothetical protein
MPVCLGSLLVTVVTINWIVNPYGVWRTTVVDRAYRLTDAAADEGGERLSTPYRIRAEQPSTVLVGSSRVLRGMLVAQSGHDTFFNASLGGATFAELAILLRLATANPRLRRVIWGIDFYAFDERFVGFRHPETRRRLEVDEQRVLALQVRETLFTMRALRDSSRVLMRVSRGKKAQSLTNAVPWPEHLIKERLANVSRRGLGRGKEATIKRQLQNWIVSYVDYRLSGPQVTLFQNAVADLRRTGLEVILFVPPLSNCELETIDQAGEWDTFQRWKGELLGVVGPYWDFSGYGKLDLSPELFADVAHFKPEVGQVILRRLLDMDCSGCGETARTIWDAGVWVDATTVNAYLARQEATRAAIRHPDAGCAKVVEAVLGARATSTSRPP